MCQLQNLESFPAAYKLFQRNRTALLFINVEFRDFKTKSLLKRKIWFSRFGWFFRSETNLFHDGFLTFHQCQNSHFLLSPHLIFLKTLSYISDSLRLISWSCITIYVGFVSLLMKLSAVLKIKCVIIQLCCLSFNFTPKVFQYSILMNSLMRQTHGRVFNFFGITQIYFRKLMCTLFYVFRLMFRF